MPSVKLIVDSGATKAEWVLINDGKRKIITTQGISPYFLSAGDIEKILIKEVRSKISVPINEIYYYGTGLFDPANRKMIKKLLKKVFPGSVADTNDDMTGVARALCGREQGIACNLGTGTNSCYFNGKKVVKGRPGLGYILGDEGSGAYLGKKVIQYYLYDVFDEELRYRFTKKYNIDRAGIIENVYKKPFPNRYLASFALFLAENRRHYMVENIIEDGLNDFFFIHLCKYSEVWKYPVNFVGSVAFGFKDVLKELCKTYEFEMGIVLKRPMNGLIDFHS